MNVQKLDQIPLGATARICALDESHEWTPSLRRLGFREGAEIELLSGYDPILLRCEGSCLAVGRCMLDGVSIFECKLRK